MDLLVGNGVVEATGIPFSTYLIEAWARDCADPISKQIDDTLLKSEATKQGGKQETDLAQVEKYKTSWLTQFTVLFHRCLRNGRSAVFTPLNLIKSAAIGFVVGCLWYQRPYSEWTVFDRR